MRRRILLVAAALVLAAVSAATVLGYARSADRRAVAGRTAVTVLLARTAIPAGTTGERIRRDGLAEAVTVPATTVPRDALRSLGPGTDGLRLTAGLQPRQLLLRGQFGTGVGAGLGAAVPAGMLAVSVEVATAPGVAEQVVAGDRVAVFTTYPRGAPPGEQRTRILLPRAVVVGTGAGPGGPAPSPGVAGRVAARTGPYPATLAVDQADALRLVHAAQTGLVYLGLLGRGTTVSPAPAVDDDNLWGTP